MKITAKTNRFTQIAIGIMCTVFLMNLVLSKDYNLSGILLSGGGSAVDMLGASRTAVLKDFQYYRLITYGYTHAAVWHLAANLFGLWYVLPYLEKRSAASGL